MAIPDNNSQKDRHNMSEFFSFNTTAVVGIPAFLSYEISGIAEKTCIADI